MAAEVDDGAVTDLIADGLSAARRDWWLSRITLPGSIYLGLVAVLPNLFLSITQEGQNQNFPFGGTAVLIMVGVGLETVKQIETQLNQRSYEGFLR